MSENFECADVQRFWRPQSIGELLHMVILYSGMCAQLLHMWRGCAEVYKRRVLVCLTSLLMGLASWQVIGDLNGSDVVNSSIVDVVVKSSVGQSTVVVGLVPGGEELELSTGVFVIVSFALLGVVAVILERLFATRRSPGGLICTARCTSSTSRISN